MRTSPQRAFADDHEVRVYLDSEDFLASEDRGDYISVYVGHGSGTEHYTHRPEHPTFTALAALMQLSGVTCIGITEAEYKAIVNAGE